MKFSKTNTLDTQQILEIKDLQHICFFFERLSNEPYLSNALNVDLTIPCFFLCHEGLRLVGFLAAFFPTGEEVEVNAFVHPDYRKKGIFSSLVAEARSTYEKLSFLQMLFQVEDTSESGKAYIQKRYPTIDRTEYRLTLPKSRWQEKKPLTPFPGAIVEARGEYLELFIKTATSLIREEAGFVERTLTNPDRKGYLYLHDTKPIGVLQKCKEDEQLTMIYGVAIDENYRGQGYGKAMLSLALDFFFESCTYLSLEVDSQNPRAFGLYRTLGFEIDFQVAYHSLILS